MRGESGRKGARPRARTGVVVRRVGEETVVYDPVTHVAHCLSPEASEVFRAATGSGTIEAIAARLTAETGHTYGEAAVAAAIEGLLAANLLESASVGSAVPSRRLALQRLGLGAMALAPIVTSLVVPSPAEAAATCVPQAACTASNAGQPCFVLSQTECLTKVCTGVSNICQ